MRRLVAADMDRYHRDVRLVVAALRQVEHLVVVHLVVAVEPQILDEPNLVERQSLVLVAEFQVVAVLDQLFQKDCFPDEVWLDEAPQVAVLEQLFQKDYYPDGAQQVSVASHLGEAALELEQAKLALASMREHRL